MYAEIDSAFRLQIKNSQGSGEGKRGICEKEKKRFTKHM